MLHDPLALIVLGAVITAACTITTSRIWLTVRERHTARRKLAADVGRLINAVLPNGGSSLDDRVRRLEEDARWNGDVSQIIAHAVGVDPESLPPRPGPQKGT
jgi:hypothetical protein